MAPRLFGGVAVLGRLLLVPTTLAAEVVHMHFQNVYSVNTSSKEHYLPDISYQASAPRPPRTPVPRAIREAITKNLDCSRHGWELRQGGRARLIDSFLFSNELDILEARLNELYDFVDVFLIVELGTGHQGWFRNSTFLNCLAEPRCAARFMPLMDKVRYFFVGSLDVCLARLIWPCERSHRGLLNWAFKQIGGRNDDMVTVGDADEFPDAATAWALAHCAVPPEGLKIGLRWYYYSAHCRVPVSDDKLRAVSGRLLRFAGADVIRMAYQKNNSRGLHFVHMGNGGYHLAYFLSPEEVEFKIKHIMCHSEFNRTPFNTLAWIAENTRMCIYAADWLYRSAKYVKSADIAYPDIPWYALAKPDAMASFHRYASDDALATSASASSPSVAVCITGWRLEPFTFDVSAVARGLGHMDESKIHVFAAVHERSCRRARHHVDPGSLQCLDEAPLARTGKLPSRHARHYMFQYRMMKACLMMALSRGTYDWILSKRTDVLLREFPSAHDLSESAVFTAAQQTNSVRLLDAKLFLARPWQMTHVENICSLMTKLAYTTDSVSPARAGLTENVLANATKPACLLQRVFKHHGVAIRSQVHLRYDEVSYRSYIEDDGLQLIAALRAGYARNTP